MGGKQNQNGSGTMLVKITVHYTYKEGIRQMNNQVLGNCHGDANPEAWFPTTYNGGRASVMFKTLLPNIEYALEKCNSCPVRERCLEEGMKPINLGLGIWGGKFAGERILMARERGIDYSMPEYNKGRKLSQRRDYAWPEPFDGITLQEEEDALLFHERVSHYLGDLTSAGVTNE